MEVIDRAALARYEQTRAAGDQIVRLLQSTPWDRSDLARLRTVIDELDLSLATEEAEQQRSERAQTAHQGRRVWVEGP